jgi:hypothetical protein
MIEELLKTFAVPEKKTAPPVVQTPKPQEPTACSVCGGIHQWQPKRSDRWHCVICQPPPAPSLVASERGLPERSPAASGTIRDENPPSMFRHVASRYYYTVVEPCFECRGRLVTETNWNDSSAELKCWTCGHISQARQFTASDGAQTNG